MKAATAERVMGAAPGMLMTPPSGRFTAEHLDANEDAVAVAAPAISWRGSMAGDKSRMGCGQPLAVSLVEEHLH